ncbi:APH(3')-I family aminoglycoside O-phosphotransferase [Sphingomonas sp. TZW2008]|uniref:APH(3')-I family aminoglycoside O-phosphotransferase n=1 Tax=Sphingomonas sp. TZW2008 TaxID=1917973 RepID=UPI00211A2626|nr:APH(3')-I family aminoglycoside O-phosphotransferase [Sphingomonas sp. TZW2008]
MDMDREEACAAIALPDSLSSSLIGYRWARNSVGESSCEVYRLHGKSGAPDLYLKHGQGASADDIGDEMIRLRWLGAHMPVPSVEGFVATRDEAWLLMTALPGQTAYQLLEAQPGARLAIVDAIAVFLRRIHAIPTERCPFVSDHVFRLAQARDRIAAGLVDEDDFDDERAGWTAEQVWDAMQRLLPMGVDRVVTHGDFSLDNILMLDGAVVGCIDVGRAGIADRYQDLAILWNCLGEFDASLQARLFRSYGSADVDDRKLQFHLLLDELF